RKRGCSSLSLQTVNWGTNGRPEWPDTRAGDALVRREEGGAGGGWFPHHRSIVRERRADVNPLPSRIGGRAVADLKISITPGLELDLRLVGEVLEPDAAAAELQIRPLPAAPHRGVPDLHILTRRPEGVALHQSELLAPHAQRVRLVRSEFD